MINETTFQPTTAAICHSSVMSLLNAASSRPVMSASALYANALMVKLEMTTRGRWSHEGSLDGGGSGVSVGSMVVEVVVVAGSVAKSRVLTSGLN